ncbi:MAG: tRNA preQ1(34) S-adenosylmethionine ribosyltransferase-isomerase QueA, partial [Thermoanaerobaculia bacterium]|nr:tRNA preQ1(34) S-adenosylmethionine ribosyltransferase-isomerase QueA [Thermoanaerobaculia bacterium]
MLVREFDYDLPPELIAQEARPRGQSRLLHLDGRGQIHHHRFPELPDLLSPGDLVVVNDTLVLPARLFGRRRPGGGRIEILLVEKAAPAEWDALVRPGRKARSGTVIDLDRDLSAEVVAKGDDGRHRLRFSGPVLHRLRELGHVPLPPYIKREDRPEDRERYQTVWAREPGAIAAPTAGLHFTEEILAELEDRGIGIASLTLHVGIGTFKPVTADLVHEHTMDSERYEIPPETVGAIRSARETGGRIVAVGTTTTRALEGCAADHGGPLADGPRETDLFITPGFEFRVIDLLLTNFHLPKSTLLMLVSAFAGRERVLSAYREAIRERYRFYS